MLEFRIPISPTESFFQQVRLFNHCLRRLGNAYADSRLTVTVGDCCDINEVRRVNRWSESFNILWDKVPDSIVNDFGIHGTAHWRLVSPEPVGNIIFLSDADTVLIKEVDSLLPALAQDRPTWRGHMAHFPPPVQAIGLAPGADLAFWPQIFERFGARLPPQMYRYSMDIDHTLPTAPAYFNLGFVALNRAAWDAASKEVIALERAFRTQVDSHMRCQIAVTLIAYKNEHDIEPISAIYNAANDLRHFTWNKLRLDDICVIHYLREDEFTRRNFLLNDGLREFLSRSMNNPVNQLFQGVVRDYQESL